MSRLVDSFVRLVRLVRLAVRALGVPVLACAFAFASALASWSCRGCDDGSGARGDAGAQPTMPTGMLAPRTASSGGEPAAGTKSLRLSSAGASGGGVVLRPDLPDDAAAGAAARSMSVDAMTLLHPMFARALPGFDLFVPRRFDRDALGRLRVELAAFKQEWVSVGTLAAAKERFGARSSFVRDLASDEAWIGARDGLTSAIDDITKMADELEQKGSGLWVQGA